MRKVVLEPVFDTVDHKTIWKKFQYYGIKEKNLSWLEIYITSQKEGINFEINNKNGKTELLEIICGVSQGSILGPLLFIIYRNHLRQVLDILNPIMFCRWHKLISFEQWYKDSFLNTNL